MKLLILSDLHLEFAPFQPQRDIQFDAVLLAGDIGSPGHGVPAWARAQSMFGDKPILYVAGNHEYYGSSHEDERLRLRTEANLAGVHFLDPGMVVLDGVRFVGATLWTDFELRVKVNGGMAQGSGSQRLIRNPAKAMHEAALYLNDFHVIRSAVRGGGQGVGPGDEGRFTSARALELHRSDLDYLQGVLKQPFDGPTVVLTHHAPHRGSVAVRYEDDWLTPCFASELPADLFETPRLWVHGHMHASFDYRVGGVGGVEGIAGGSGENGCRVICNPRGYPQWNGSFENPQFDPARVIEV